MWIPAACGRGSAPVIINRINVVARVGRGIRHHVGPGDAVLLHQAMCGAGGVVALAEMFRSQHAEQARQTLAVGDGKRVHTVPPRRICVASR
jgi:hypothetical protein